MEENKIFLKQTYNYFLPENLIAQTPLENREQSRMLCYDRKSKNIEHKHFYDIIDYLKEGDVLVLNSSKVLPARIYGFKIETNAKIEILLQKRLDLTSWKVLARPAKRLNVGTVIKFSDKLSATVLKKLDYGECEIVFKYNGVFENILAEIGEMPLPPYIHEKLKNKNRYQTVYAKEEGSSAAPTAGLHFTFDILEKLKQKGVKVVEVLLHVGLGTFRPVKDNNILNHQMHEEFFVLTEETAFRVTKKFIRENKELPDAIFGINDETAIGIIEALQEEGIRVPEEISVIGCDNISSSRFVQPPLTTIEMPKFEVGILAANMLLRRIRGMPTENIVLSGKLIIRESCCKKSKTPMQASGD